MPLSHSDLAGLAPGDTIRCRMGECVVEQLSPVLPGSNGSTVRYFNGRAPGSLAVTLNGTLTDTGHGEIVAKAPAPLPPDVLQRHLDAGMREALRPRSFSDLYATMSAARRGQL